MSFESITIFGGVDKDGKDESIRELTIGRGEIYSVIGFTGSGKSRLIRDIEQLAQGDTVTKRRILTDGKIPEYKYRRAPEFKIVAHLTQNMNYITDLKCGEFLRLRAECRKIPAAAKNAERIIMTANGLCGEPISDETPLTALSGGQSRALMIADTAINADAPIILIDEIENAGIDKKAAMETLVGNEKIVLVVTHDPLLALSGKRRIVMRNGGMAGLLGTTERERDVFDRLRELNAYSLEIQRRLRAGETL
ncbi:MAG: ATP-binding cassette domain-containing protein [Clostridiales bacterium]|jgi:ABC-type lipoprotein export system ATPase subunit|nr:ATP-binding cassette domain-containing protein [Clostridiales bacterium]